jgi:hypothetical protein
MSLLKIPKIWGFIQFLKWMEKHLVVCAQCVPSYQPVSSTVLQQLARNRITRIPHWNLQLKTELTANFRNVMRIVVLGLILRRLHYFALRSVQWQENSRTMDFKGFWRKRPRPNPPTVPNSPRNTGKTQESIKIAVAQAQPRTRYLPNTSKDRHCSYSCQTYLR